MHLGGQSTFFFLRFWVWAGFLIPGLSGFSERDITLVFPSPIKEGDDLKLMCMFTKPRNATIDSVKWYKGQREIFRYLPTDPISKKQFFPLGDLMIDERNSDMKTLSLKQVPAYMSGAMSCEVTPEPPYSLVTKTAQLLVAVPPKEKPTLGTSLGMFSHNLHVYQKLVANCTSPPSKPALNLTFYINDVPIHQDDPGIGLISHRDIGRNDTEIQRTELELLLQKHHFRGGKIRLRCTGTMFNLYNSTSDEFIGEQIKPNSQKQNSIYRRTGAATTIHAGIFLTLSTTSFACRNLLLK